MTMIIVVILRLAGIVLAVVGVLAVIGTIQQLQQVIEFQGLASALPALLVVLYPIIGGALLYGFGEIISLLAQIRDRAGG